MDRNETAPGTRAKVNKPVDEVANRRIKKVDLDLLPHRLSLAYEEVGILLHRGKAHIEKLVASRALIAMERGRVSRRQVEAYVERMDSEALAIYKSPPIVRPKRRSSRRQGLG
jgi:hypothetical protein